MKNNKQRYIVVDFEEYEAIKEIKECRKKKIDGTADTLIEDLFHEISKMDRLQ